MRRKHLLVGCSVCWIVAIGVIADGSEIKQERPFATRVLEITNLVLEHHVDPPTRQQMILAGTKSLLVAANIQPPIGLSRRISALSSEAEFTSFLEDVWKQAIAESNHSPEKLLAAMTEGLLRVVPGSPRLISNKQARVSEQFANNRYVGIGIALSIHRETKRARMTRVLPGGPSERAGAKTGDLILSIDGVSTENETISHVVDKLRGEEGSLITLELRQPDEENIRTLKFARGVVPFQHVKNYKTMPLGNDAKVGYLQFAQISASVVHELREYERKMQSEGVRAVILDMTLVRGGTVHHTVMLADALLDGGEIGRVRTTNDSRKYSARPDCLFRDWPLVILMNSNTFGVAEWLVAALKDNGRAVLVGTQTAAQGYVTTVVPIPGTDESLKLNTGLLERADGTPLAIPEGAVMGLSNVVLVQQNGSFLRMDPDANSRNKTRGVLPDHWDKSAQLVRQKRLTSVRQRSRVRGKRPPKNSTELRALQRRGALDIALDVLRDTITTGSKTSSETSPSPNGERQG